MQNIFPQARGLIFMPIQPQNTDITEPDDVRPWPNPPPSTFISVILCTYNPDEILLESAFRSIRDQEIRKSHYEVIIVDNNSDVPLEQANITDVLGRGATLLREERQGLTYARLKGIEASKGDLLVFVDDDNEICS